MPAIDFITALGALLRDGALRDVLAADPRAAAARLNLRESDRAALAQLVPADLEFQADVLLRKRFNLVRRIIPETCRLLGAEMWPAFHAYARVNWPPRERAAAHDAHDFCRHLQRHHPDCVCEAEWNRLRFVHAESRFALHWIRRQPTRHQSKHAVQLLLRLGQRRWREIIFYLRL